MREETKKPLFGTAYLLLSILVAEAAGAIGSFFTVPNADNWYAFLVKPSWSPPDWLFGPVWVTLYFLMAISAYLVWEKRGPLETKLALWLYGASLALNALWPIIFFGAKMIGLAFFEIVVLLLLIISITAKFYRIRKAAGILFMPYVLWVAFAAVLNFTIWILH